MPSAGGPRAGVLVVRAWIEDHPTSPLRAVITVDDVEGDVPPTRLTASTVDEVVTAVRAWLEVLTGTAPP